MDGRRADRNRSVNDERDTVALPVHALTTAEALLVWGMRHWVACLKAGTDPIPLLTAGFGSGGVAGVVRPLDAILVITLETATAARDVRCGSCATVGDGERDLLAAVAFEQGGRPDRCLGTLRGWLPPASARLAKELVAEIARALQIRGLSVPMRPDDESRRAGGKHPDIRDAVPASLSVH